MLYSNNALHPACYIFQDDLFIRLNTVTEHLLVSGIADGTGLCCICLYRQLPETPPPERVSVVKRAACSELKLPLSVCQAYWGMQG